MVEKDCLFCNIFKEKKYLFENDLAFAILDSFPVSNGHTLIIPKRHAPSYFEVTPEEAASMKQLLDKVKDYLDTIYHPDGYNIGLNCGADAGQSIFHCHMHVIPRYKGDDPSPRGGVRKIIKKPKVEY